MRFLQKLSHGIRMMSKKLINPSAERNKQPILEIVQKYFAQNISGNVLEIASGTGQHISYIAPHYPYLTFQPSDYDINMVKEIKLYVADCPTKNIKQPLHIDITSPIETWGLDTHKYNYMININMMHISPYICTEGLFRTAGRLLIKDGLMITYGPYAVNGKLEPQSNINFDNLLRHENPEWGVRDVEQLKEEAELNGLILMEIHNMPSNNKSLIWKKM